jgi:carboxyl-terminal processing protease
MHNDNLKFKTYLILTFVLLLGTFSFSFFAFAAESNRLSTEVAGDPPPQIERIFSAIYTGDFTGAREALGGSPQSKSAAINQLINIISEYEAVDAKRQSTREDAYREELAELEKLRVQADTNGINDINDITAVLLVTVQASDLADERQKAELLSEPFIQKVFQKAIEKAAEYESEGKWLDAYLICYSWLQAIDEDNKAYSDYGDELYEKANIVASFQDSPCESRKERYENVKKSVFVRAVDVLDSHSVVEPDYRQMATKAIRRCKLLAEVISKSFEQISQSENSSVKSKSGEDSFLPPNSEELVAWSASLDEVMREVNKLLIVGRDNFLEVFNKVLELNTTSVRDKEKSKIQDTLLPQSVLIAQFTEAAFSTVDDYTVMVWPRQAKDFDKIMTNKFTGIGVLISKEKGLLTVASLLPDTPAYNGGLDAGDVIEKVDGVGTKDMSLPCAVKNITGPAGTKVKLTIKRPGEEEARDIIITRAEITVPTIRGWQRTEEGRWLYMIDEASKIGYVRVTNFSDKTAADLDNVLGKLESDGLKGLILDLRSNTGGLLDSAVEVSDRFIEKGMIVSTRPRSRFVWTHAKANKENTHPDYPVVILINRFSASASEIVAGALADVHYNRAILVGERTAGKGSVQGITHYPGEGARLKYTMAYYHLPSGQRVESKDAAKKEGRDDWGIGPDVTVRLRTDELTRMSEVQRDNDVLARAGTDMRAVPLKKHGIEETLASDPQLAIGVLIVKSKLIEGMM